MPSFDASAFLVDMIPATDAGIWDQVITALADHADRNHSGAQIRIAGKEASERIAAERSAAWIVAQFGEPAIIIIRDGLPAGLATWHAARMLVALGGSPSALEPGEVGVIHSREKPPKGWASPEDENLDRLATATLRSMGLPRWLIRRISK